MAANQTTTQIRVSPKAHRTLSRMSKQTGAPITKIVDRLLKQDSQASRAPDANGVHTERQSPAGP